MTAPAVDDGEVDPTPATHAWRVDTVAPTLTITASPGALDNTVMPTFVFSASEPGVTFTCSLDGGPLVPCESPWQVGPLADGSHTVTIVAVDAAGNPVASPYEYTWTVDTSTPDTVIDAAPAAVVASASATFEFSALSAGAGPTFACALDGAAAQPCTSPATYPGLAEGAHTFAVAVTNAAGTSDPSPATHAWSIDLTGPTVELTLTPGAATATPVATFAFTAADAASFTCEIIGLVPEATCTSPYVTPALADGEHTFVVRAVDAVGNPGSADHAWTVDATPPTLTITAAPGPVTSNPVATVAFTVDEPATTTCSLDGAAPAPCTSPVVTAALAVGNHTLDITATDLVGNGGGDGAIFRVALLAWSAQSTPVLSPRDSPAAAYDAARGEVVAFGGLGYGPPNRGIDETWVWDGTRWTQKFPATSPTPRLRHAMAYDAARAEIVIFSGDYNTNVNQADTWVWDGSTWTERSPATSPTARYFHAMAYDAARAEVVLFGGTVGLNGTNDTWVWNGTTWTQRLPATSPVKRSLHSMAYDAARAEIVMFSGGTSGGAPADTWVWNGTTWTQRLPPTSPPGRRYGQMAYDAARAEIVIYGGQNSSSSWLTDTWAWDGTTWIDRSVAGGPSGRIYHALVGDDARGEVLLLSGRPPTYVTESFTWAWDGSAWAERARSQPPFPPAPRLAFDEDRGEVMTFNDDETWTWSGSAWQRLAPATSPPARTRGALAYDRARGVVVLFGGVAGSLSTVLNDTWLWDGTTWIDASPATSPPTRFDATMAYDRVRDQVVLFGGFGAGSLGDTWGWDGTDWTLLHAGGAGAPAARRNHQMAFDDLRGTIVLFGSDNGSDTWSWNGSAWTQGGNGPLGGGDKWTLARDPDSQRVVLLGTNTTAQLWTWNGTTWTADALPAIGLARKSAATAYDEARHEFVIFDGYGVDGAYLGDTWLLSPVPQRALRPALARPAAPPRQGAEAQVGVDRHRVTDPLEHRSVVVAVRVEGRPREIDAVLDGEALGERDLVGAEPARRQLAGEAAAGDLEPGRQHVRHAEVRGHRLGGVLGGAGEQRDHVAGGLVRRDRRARRRR
ncbi:MAG: hypothetical protein R2939_06335 [Kofleriaceae bacterium]